MNKVEALAESWASIDGKLERFRACKADAAVEQVEQCYGGYISEAEEMIRRLERRGFALVPAASNKDS